MQFFLSASKAFIGMLAPALVFVLINKFVVKHGYQLWATAGIAIGISIAMGIQAQWKLQRLAAAALTGTCVAACSLISLWISTGL